MVVDGAHTQARPFQQVHQQLVGTFGRLADGIDHGNFVVVVEVAPLVAEQVRKSDDGVERIFEIVGYDIKKAVFGNVGIAQLLLRLAEPLFGLFAHYRKANLWRDNLEQLLMLFADSIGILIILHCHHSYHPPFDHKRNPQPYLWDGANGLYRSGIDELHELPTNEQQAFFGFYHQSAHGFFGRKAIEAVVFVFKIGQAKPVGRLIIQGNKKVSCVDE